MSADLNELENNILVTQIDFYRWVPDVHKLEKAVKLKKQDYKGIFDLWLDYTQITNISKQEALDLIQNWLKDHFGICIYYTTTKEKTVKKHISNTKLMKTYLNNTGERIFTFIKEV